MVVLKLSKERTSEDNKQLVEQVEQIISNVRKKGQDALKQYSNQFDHCTRNTFLVGKDEIEKAYEEVGEEEIARMKQAMENVWAFAQAQKNTMLPLSDFSPMEGVILGHKIIPVEGCCCYVPGGNYPLYSSAWMLAIPAKVAGVKRVVACSPTMKGTNKIHPKTIVAMDLAGVDEIYALGGAHAIAAFSYGTEEIKPVDLIVGPGNRYVTEAKRQCYGQVGIDFIAGPSEVFILADETAKKEVIAADLLAQSEHDVNAKGILVTTDIELGKAVIEEVERQLEQLGTKEIARSSWETYGEVLVVDSMEEGVLLANEYAPEHLEVHVASPECYLDKLNQYGSLFLGEYTAEVFGDYVSGTNHTLPTLKAARYTGGVWVGTFLKVCTYQSMTKVASKKLSSLVEQLALGEGLEGHAMAAKIRGTL